MIPMSFITRLSFLDLTEESDGNAAGYGLADLSGLHPVVEVLPVVRAHGVDVQERAGRELLRIRARVGLLRDRHAVLLGAPPEDVLHVVRELEHAEGL